MHELSVAQSLVALVEKIATENRAKKIKKIEIELGSFCGVDRQSLLFCFQAVSFGTLAEEAKIEIIESQVERDLKLRAIEVE